MCDIGMKVVDAGRQIQAEVLKALGQIIKHIEVQIREETMITCYSKQKTFIASPSELTAIRQPAQIQKDSYTAEDHEH